ncbi:hypothetical protein BTL50_08060 [Bordetella holmesii]|nr:hypothetical protein H558_14210 [Bordetella holmesii H558]AMD50510.1 hypothetical protein F783_003860 [Bordetella holmesii F627]AOB35438.1 hypothetical protein BBB42_07980 [Bordetella holmesii]AUL19419.1 hypothetical protein BTL46_07975 [Bordetella holmesii]AUL22757.1 hypothetical protein BTL48_08065 [Bordetella holmesii]
MLQRTQHIGPQNWLCTQINDPAVLLCTQTHHAPLMEIMGFSCPQGGGYIAAPRSRAGTRFADGHPTLQADDAVAGTGVNVVGAATGKRL